jgi:hypothetical protein
LVLSACVLTIDATGRVGVGIAASIRKRQKSGWSFYEVIFGTYFEVTLTFF